MHWLQATLLSVKTGVLRVQGRLLPPTSDAAEAGRLLVPGMVQALASLEAAASGGTHGLTIQVLPLPGAPEGGAAAMHGGDAISETAGIGLTTNDTPALDISVGTGAVA